MAGRLHHALARLWGILIPPDDLDPSRGLRAGPAKARRVPLRDIDAQTPEGGAGATGEPPRSFK
jgi:hypothetical protein